MTITLATTYEEPEIIDIDQDRDQQQGHQGEYQTITLIVEE